MGGSGLDRLLFFKNLADQEWIGFFFSDQDWTRTEKFHSTLVSGNLKRFTESEIFDSDFAPASVEYTPTPLRNILKFWTPTPA